MGLGPDAALPTALLSGEMILDGEGCLRVRAGANGPTWVPVWPADYRLSTGTGAVRVKGPDDRTVAEVGKKASMGGGEVGLQGDMVDRSTIRELRERCPGEYWSVLDSSVGPPPKPASIPGPKVNGRPKLPS
jgi:hypothetical protein